MVNNRALSWRRPTFLYIGKAVIIGTINNDAGVDFENTKLKDFVHSRLNVDTVYNIPLLTIKQTIAIIEHRHVKRAWAILNASV